MRDNGLFRMNYKFHFTLSTTRITRRDNGVRFAAELLFFSSRPREGRHTQRGKTRHDSIVVCVVGDTPRYGRGSVSDLRLSSLRNATAIPPKISDTIIKKGAGA